MRLWSLLGLSAGLLDTNSSDTKGWLLYSDGMRWRATIPLLVLPMLAGCSGGHDSAVVGSSSGKPSQSLDAAIVGKWKVDPSVASTDAPGHTGFMMGFSSTFWYEFKADKTFSGAMSEGTYTLKGTKLEVTTAKVAGQNVSATQPHMMGELSSDGKTLTLHLPGAELLKMMPDKLQHGIPMAKESN